MTPFAVYVLNLMVWPRRALVLQRARAPLNHVPNLPA